MSHNIKLTDTWIIKYYILLLNNTLLQGIQHNMLLLENSQLCDGIGSLASHHSITNYFPIIACPHIPYMISHYLDAYRTDDGL